MKCNVKKQAKYIDTSTHIIGTLTYSLMLYIRIFLAATRYGVSSKNDLSIQEGYLERLL